MGHLKGILGQLKAGVNTQSKSQSFAPSGRIFTNRTDGLTSPWPGRRPRSVYILQRIFGNGPSRVSNIQRRKLRMQWRRVRTQLPYARRLQQWTSQPNGKFRHTRSLRRCNVSSAWDDLPASTLLHTGGTRRHIRCKRADIQFLLL